MSESTTQSNLVNLIKSVFYDPSTGLISAKKLYDKLKPLNNKITMKLIKNFLDKQMVVQVHKKPIKNTSFIANEPLEEFQIDLIHIENPHLNNSRYGLTCIDSFSRFAHVELMKDKTAKNTLDAFKKCVDKIGMPKSIYCDEGSEFKSTEFQNYCDENHINLIFPISHAPIVERFNRTLKEILNKYLEVSKTKTITTVLSKILNNYNNTVHSTIGMTPNEALKKSHQFEAYMNIVSKSYTTKPKPQIKVGDQIRIMLKPKSTDKKYKPQYSDKIYTVSKVENGQIHIDGIKRTYLNAHVQKVKDNVDETTIEPDYEGTKEQHIKELSKRNIIEKNIKYDENKSVAKTKPKRMIKVRTKLTI